MYHYLLNHHGNHAKVAEIMSRFGEVYLDEGRDRAGNSVHWLRFPEYNIVDLLYAYKDRADGGLGLGSKQQSYSLNNVAMYELGLTKYEYAAEGLTLDQLYEKDPLNFLLYNLYDTVLVYKINKKTEIIELYNSQRRKMHTPLGSALRGSSPLFDTFIYGTLKNQGKYVRWGINNESSFGISAEELSTIPKVKTITKINWNIDSMDSRTCSKLMNKFQGALNICAIKPINLLKTHI